MTVQRHGRRVLVPDYRRAFATVKNDRDALVEELIAVKADRDRLLGALIDLQNATRNCERAQAELNSLYRQRDIRHALAAERDFDALLH